jgi:hypothetical protein
MRNKFTMSLVWHNCATCPPKEFENPFLIVTDGRNVYGASWHRAEGYYTAYDTGNVMLSFELLEHWWWADIEQTVQGTKEFKEDRL